MHLRGACLWIKDIRMRVLCVSLCREPQEVHELKRRSRIPFVFCLHNQAIFLSCIAPSTDRKQSVWRSGCYTGLIRYPSVHVNE